MIFFGGLLLVKVVIGEVVMVEEFGGGEFYVCCSGVVDYFVEDDEYVFEIFCDIVVIFLLFVVFVWDVVESCVLFE